jgi:hypothetical protein
MRYVIGILLLASPAFAGEPVYTWRTRADDPDRAYLYQDGNQIGGWDYRVKQYRTFDGKNWGAPTDTPPVRLPQTWDSVNLRLQPIVITQPLQMRGPVQIHGPLRGGLADAMGQAMADMYMQLLFDALPRAILDSMAKGQFKVESKSSVVPSPQQPEGRTIPPSPGRPMRNP